MGMSGLEHPLICFGFRQTGRHCDISRSGRTEFKRWHCSDAIFVGTYEAVERYGLVSGGHWSVSGGGSKLALDSSGNVLVSGVFSGTGATRKVSAAGANLWWAD